MTLRRWQKREAEHVSYGRFARACKNAGSRNLVDELLDPFRLTHLRGEAPSDVSAALRLFTPRPWYSVEELARLWPLVCIGLACKDVGRKPTPDVLRKRLGQYLPLLRDWGGGTEYRWQGKWQEFFIVQDVHRVARLRFSQNDFDAVMNGEA
jgi:hypothetical protein